jgi:rhodanese-related sulfurtransferase
MVETPDAATSVRGGVLRAALLSGILLIGFVLQLLAGAGAPLTNGEVLRLDVSNPNIEIPEGGRVVTIDGREPLELERSAIPGGERVILEHLEPGEYRIIWPGPGLGGTHLDQEARLVIVDAVGAHTRSDRGTGSGAYVAMAVMFVLAALAGSSARTGKLHLAFAGSLLVVTVLWAASGWHRPDPASVIAYLFAAGAAAGTILTRRQPLDGLLVVTALAVLLWPDTMVTTGAIAVTLAVLVALLAASTAGQLDTNSDRSLRKLLGRLRTNQALSAASAVVCALLLSGAAWAAGTAAGEAARPALDFAECARRAETDQILGRECFRAVAAELGASLPAAEASQALLDGLDAAGVRKDSQCRTAGGALSHAAARWGAERADPRALFVELAPICDYSSMHGIISGAFAHTDPETFAAGVLALCTPESPDETRLNSPEYSRQCWQAAGIALGRRTRYAEPQALELCAQAVPYGVNNCTDGYFQEFIDQKARAAKYPATRLHPSDASVLTLCSSLPDALAGGCYRYVGEEVFYEGGSRSEGLRRLEEVCADEVPAGHRKPCWYALGMVAVRSLQEGTFEEFAAPVLDLCPKAPDEQTLLQCLHGGGNAVVGLLGQGVDIERICAWFPEHRREEFCEYTRRYQDHLREGDPN